MAGAQEPRDIESPHGVKVVVYVGVVLAVTVSLAISVGTSLVVSLLVQILSAKSAGIL